MAPMRSDLLWKANILIARLEEIPYRPDEVLGAFGHQAEALSYYINY